jgi:hypothetical protein
MTSNDSNPPVADQALTDHSWDLQAFAVSWSGRLEAMGSRTERALHHEEGAGEAQRAIKGNALGSWEFARLWMRRFGDDLIHDRLPSPLPSALEAKARELVRAAFQKHAPEIATLGSTAEITEPIALARQAPRTAGILRDLGRTVAAFRGSGVLSQENPELIERLVTFDEALRNASRRTVALVPEHLRITRRELINWADSGSGHELPGLIRRLVVETTDGLERAHFPAGVGASSGGWDGVVFATIGNSVVPEGLSVWELSKERNSNEKAENDYAKRLTAPDSMSTADATFVEVICRPWIKASNFAAKHMPDGRWKSVRAYNVDDIESWLERAPSTTIWLLEQLGRPVAGIITAEQWWTNWIRSTRIPLRASVVLAGRETERDTLQQRTRSPGVTTLGGDVRLEEVHAFVAATFVDFVNEPAPAVLFLSDTADARKLLARPGDLVVVVPNAKFITDIDLSHHHAIVPTPGSNHADITVPLVSSRLVNGALEIQGVPGRDGREFGALARRSLLALRRRLALRPELHEPSWAATGADVVRRRVLLAQSWNQAKPGDCDAISNLIGQPYASIEDAMRLLSAAHDDAMVAIFDERWHVVSPMDTWMLLGPQLSTSDLEAFRAHVLAVVLEPDPLAEVAPADRWRASLDGIRRRYSGDLVRGAISALALLATADDVVHVGGRTGESVASSIVWELLDAANKDTTPRTWITLAPHLPLLAEAAPSVLLSALRRALAPNAIFTQAVFADAEPSTFGLTPQSPHTHVVWALETLVWSEKHFDEAVSVLAVLAELDPGGQWSNRPAASLASVFCPWHPNTSAGPDQRLITVGRLRKQHPEVAWNLLLTMLPNSHGFLMVDQGPQFRDWKSYEPIVTHAGYDLVVNAVAQALIEDAGDRLDRWQRIVKELKAFPPEARAAARVRMMEGVSQKRFSGVEGQLLWAELRNLIALHREHNSANWALPSAELDELQLVADELVPASLAHRHAWLFGEGLVRLGDLRHRDNFEEYNRELAERRAEAVKEISNENGLKGVAQFASACPNPGQVGAALAQATGASYEIELIEQLDSSETAQANLAFGYFSRRFTSAGWTWLDSLIDKQPSLSPSTISRLLRATWDPVQGALRADASGEAVARDFWEHFSNFGLGYDFPNVVPASARLIGVGRAAAALDLLALYEREDAGYEYAEAVLTAFESLIDHPEDEELKHLSQDELDKLLKIVSRHRGELGLDRAMKVEWYFLPMLGYDPDATTLHHALANDPAFFVEVLSLAFRSSSNEEAEARNQQEEGVAENAYRLLSSWTTCPGVDDTGEVSSDRIRQWVTTARGLLSERDRLDVGDGQIGQALAAAPSDPDGSWPCASVRDLLEELQNDRVDSGLEIRVHNNRGVTSRSLDDGGRQEWGLALTYRFQSEQLLARWPRTAAIFGRLADTYERHARREDTEAEGRRRGLDR